MGEGEERERAAITTFLSLSLFLFRLFPLSGGLSAHQPHRAISAEGVARAVGVCIDESKERCSHKKQHHCRPLPQHCSHSRTHTDTQTHKSTHTRRSHTATYNSAGTHKHTHPHTHAHQVLLRPCWTELVSSQHHRHTQTHTHTHTHSKNHKHRAPLLSRGVCHRGQGGKERERVRSFG